MAIALVFIGLAISGYNIDLHGPLSGWRASVFAAATVWDLATFCAAMRYAFRGKK